MAFEVHQDSVGHQAVQNKYNICYKLVSTKFYKNNNARFKSHTVRIHTLIYHNIVCLIAKLYSNQPATRQLH